MLYLDKIYDTTFLKKKSSYSKSDFAINDLLIDDKLYKVEAYRLNDFHFIADYALNAAENYSSATKNPRNALEIQLEKGEYAIVYKSGGVVSRSDKQLNKCITMSKGEIAFDDCEFDEEITADNVDDLILSKNYSSDKYTSVKITSSSKLRMWVNKEDAVGVLHFSIYRVDQEKQDPVQVLSRIISKDDDFQINGENGIYELTVSKMEVERLQRPKTKYPVGTYQITLNTEVGRNKKESVLESLQASVKASLDFDENNRLTSLRNIEIPSDVDPLNRYVMLGKIELDLYLDFSNDKYYLYPTSYAECFMNLFVPKMKVTEIEDNDNYALYHIVDYEIIEFNYKDPVKIKNGIKRWIRCDDKDINVDPYELYYFVETFNLYSWYYAKFRSIIEKHFIYIKINADVYGYDDVSNPASDIDEMISGDAFAVQSCTWEKSPSVNKFNFINWTLGEWESAGSENDNAIMRNATGTGCIRVSRKHFERVVEADLDETETGELNEEQLNDLHINWPIINKYNRFQYWLQMSL